MKYSLSILLVIGKVIVKVLIKELSKRAVNEYKITKKNTRLYSSNSIYVYVERNNVA
jgi:hypothetical protein